MQAIILAAGHGKRLRPLTRALPKPLIPVAGKPILERTIEALEHVGVRSIILVIGFHGGLIQQYVVRRFPHLKFRFARNPIYVKTNTLYSLWAARNAVQSHPFLLIDGDLVFEPKVLCSVLAKGRGNFLACDSSAVLDGEAVRANGETDGRIIQIGKNVKADGISFGESIGLAKISAEASKRLFHTCRRILRKGGRKQYYEAAFQKMIEEGIIFQTADIRGAKWVEIDTEADLLRARILFGRPSTRSRGLALPRSQPAQDASKEKSG